VPLWYHGEPERRTRWDDQRWDRDAHTSSLNENGPGLYFTSSEEQAASYGPYLYLGELQANFKLLKASKPTLAKLRQMYGLASEYDQETFLSNWALEPGQSPDSALRRYTHRQTMFDALVGLYGDLIRDPGEWVEAMRSLGYDGTIVPRSYGVKHLVVWNPSRMLITEMF
jgi:hypothetical protein